MFVIKSYGETEICFWKMQWRRLPALSLVNRAERTKAASRINALLWLILHITPEWHSALVWSVKRFWPDRQFTVFDTSTWDEHARNGLLNLRFLVSVVGERSGVSRCKGALLTVAWQRIWRFPLDVNMLQLCNSWKTVFCKWKTCYIYTIFKAFRTKFPRQPPTFIGVILWFPPSGISGTRNHLQESRCVSSQHA